MLNQESSVLITALQNIFCVNLDLTFPFSYAFKMVTFLKQVLFIMFFLLSRNSGHLGDSEILFFFFPFLNENWLEKTFPVRENQKSSY